MTRSDMPRRVYLRHGAYYYVTPAGKWLRLCREKDGLPAMYRALGRITDSEATSERMPAVITRWLDAKRADGGLELLPLEIPEVLRPGLAALDEVIAGIVDAHREAIAATLGPFTPAELILMNEAHRLTRIVTIA